MHVIAINRKTNITFGFTLEIEISIVQKFHISENMTFDYVFQFDYHLFLTHFVHNTLVIHNTGNSTILQASSLFAPVRAPQRMERRTDHINFIWSLRFLLLRELTHEWKS